ncbi:MAG TPA: Ig domain-containing protein, partial [Chlamydiales bacterium]|nr:Ig domain-containing protein [Chlamydiales bacterium]
QPKCIPKLNFSGTPLFKHGYWIVRLSWNPSAIPSGSVLKLYRDGHFLKKFSLGHPFHLRDRHRKKGQTYKYKLVARLSGATIASQTRFIRVTDHAKKRFHFEASVQEKTNNSLVKLSWNPSVSLDAKKFKLYRNEQLLKTFSALGPFHFKDSKRKKDRKYLYTLIALNSDNKVITSTRLKVNTKSCTTTTCTPPTSTTIPDQTFSAFFPPVLFPVAGFFQSTLPLTFSAIGLPPDLIIDPITGIISGTATVFGTFDVTVTATSSCGSTSQSFTITVTPPQGGD